MTELDPQGSDRHNSWRSWAVLWVIYLIGIGFLLRILYVGYVHDVKAAAIFGTIIAVVVIGDRLFWAYRLLRGSNRSSDGH